LHHFQSFINEDISLLQISLYFVDIQEVSWHLSDPMEKGLSTFLQFQETSSVLLCFYDTYNIYISYIGNIILLSS
jgi:hypothetical protein